MSAQSHMNITALTSPHPCHGTLSGIENPLLAFSSLMWLPNRGGEGLFGKAIKPLICEVQKSISTNCIECASPSYTITTWLS